MPKPTVVILGANGALGRHVIEAILSETFRNLYTLPIRVVTRDSLKAAQIHDAKGDIKFYSADVVTGKDLDTAFDGVDVVVNLLGAGFSHNHVAEAAAAANAKLYLPSEFGALLDSNNEFINFFAAKADTIAYARGLGLKAVAVSNGPFAEFVYNTPIFGVNDPANGEFLYYGDLGTKFSVTSVRDIGKTVASLGTKDPSTIPDDVVIAGDNITIGDVPKIFKKVSGNELKLARRPLEEIRTPALKIANEGPKSAEDFATGLKGIYYTGGLNIEGKDNEFVSKGFFTFTSFEKAGESVWKK